MVVPETRQNGKFLGTDSAAYRPCHVARRHALSPPTCSTTTTVTMSNTILLCVCLFPKEIRLTGRPATRSPTLRSGWSSALFQPPDSPLSSTKEAQPEEDPSVSARLQRLQNNYEDFGMRRTVEGILVVHDHGHPHILMLQIANAFFKL